MSIEEASTDLSPGSLPAPPEDTSDPRLVLIRRGLAATADDDEPEEWRVAARHQLGLAAVAHFGSLAGLAQVPPESLGSISHAAHLWCAAARRADREGMLAKAQGWAEQAAAQLSSEGRWRPVLPDWVSQESARADLCALLVQLGRDRQGAVLAADLRPGSIEHVRTVAALSRHLPPADAWDTVAEAVAHIPRAEERDRAVAAIFAEGRPHPRFGAQASTALQLIDAVVGPPAAVDSHRAAIAGARTAARLARRFFEVPSLTAAVDAWGRAVTLAGATPPDTPGAIDVLAEVTRDQLEKVGGGPAEVTWQSTLKRVVDRPLPPDPPQLGPWAVLVGQGLRHPELAVALTRVIARQPAVPGSWAHALGRLHLVTRRPDRVERVAAVLLEAAERHSSDVESRLLAGLLLARTGEHEDDAWDALLTVISTLPSDTSATVWLVGHQTPQPYESCAVDALLAGGTADAALTLARMVTRPGLRARLIARCLGHLPAGERAGHLAEEAALALAEADAQSSAPPLDAALASLPRILWEAGDLVGAERVLRQLVGRTIESPLPTFLAAMDLLQVGLTRIGLPAIAFRAAFDEGWERRIDASSGEELTTLIAARVGLP